MTGIRLSLTFLSEFIRDRTGDLLAIWFVSTVLLVIPCLIFWFLHGSVSTPDVVMSGIFQYGVQQLNQGVPFLKAIPTSMWQTLIIIFAIKSFSLLIVHSFIQGGLAGRFLNSDDKEQLSIVTFFVHGVRNWLRMISVNLLITIIFILALGIGFGLGALVFMISSLIIYIIILVVLIYIYVRFAFTPFSVVSEGKSWFSALSSSMDKTKMFTGPIAGIVLVSAVVSQILTGYTKTILFFPEIISSFILIVQLGLLTPLYKKAKEPS